MREVIYIIIFATMVIIFSVGLLAALWALWGIAKLITEAYVELRNRWVTIHMAETRIALYVKHMREIDRWFDEHYPEEVKK